MREIEFRGKRADSEEWAYGFYALTGSNLPSIYNGKKGFDKYGNHWSAVDPSTVGQYTGLKDRNGVKIFEGDIVNAGGTENLRYCVYWNSEDFAWEARNELYDTEVMFFQVGYYFPGFEGFEVIGNIHDNFELLKEAE